MFNGGSSSTFIFSHQPSADFSGTEQENEKEHGETIKGPLREGPNSKGSK